MARWLIFNLPVAIIIALAFAASAIRPDVYYLISQEDHFIEWSTVWAFVLAAIIFAVAARKRRRLGDAVPWFYAGLAAFALLVALEEISWGQRLLSYRPPAHFLAENYQQELNLHNIVDESWRKLALLAVILGYGVVLPIAARTPGLRSVVARLGIQAPPVALVPAFAATAALYQLYPLDFSGEWVELLLGLAMLSSALAAVGDSDDLSARTTSSRPQILLAAPGITLLLGAATLLVLSTGLTGSAGRVAQAQDELTTLAEDFAHERVATRCGVHKRIYTFVQQYGQRYLTKGRFANRAWAERDEERAHFFLDPWNMPYWVRHSCRDGVETIQLYSFGPNRRRDSGPEKIAADDIGMAPADNTAHN